MFTAMLRTIWSCLWCCKRPLVYHFIIINYLAIYDWLLATFLFLSHHVLVFPNIATMEDMFWLRLLALFLFYFCLSFLLVLVLVTILHGLATCLLFGTVRVTFDGTVSFRRKCLKTCCVIISWDRTIVVSCSCKKYHIPTVVSSSCRNIHIPTVVSFSC